MNCPNNSTLLIYQLYLQPKKEGNMKKQELYNKVIAYFQETIPVAETELHYNKPIRVVDSRYPECTMHGQTGKYDHPSSLPGFPDS